MKKIDIEDDYSIYWWVIRHFLSGLKRLLAIAGYF